MRDYAIPAEIYTSSSRKRKRGSGDRESPRKMSRRQGSILTPSFRSKTSANGGVKVTPSGKFETSNFRSKNNAHINISTRNLRARERQRPRHEIRRENSRIEDYRKATGVVPQEQPIYDHPPHYPNHDYGPPIDHPNYPEESYAIPAMQPFDTGHPPHRDEYREVRPPFDDPYAIPQDYEPRRDPHFRGPRAWPEDRRHHRSPRRDYEPQTFHLPAPQGAHEAHESAIVPKEVKLSMSLDDVIAADIKKGRKYEVTRNSVLEMTKKDWKKLGFKDFMAKELVREFKLGTVFYEKNSHVYVDNDFRNLLWDIYGGPPELDTHSCPLANEGPDGVNAYHILGPHESTDGYSTNWDFKQIYSNPPYGHGGGDKKFVGKCIYEKFRHEAKYRITGETYEHIGIHAMETLNMEQWWAYMRSHSVLWFHVDRLTFRVWNEKRLQFKTKVVYPTRMVVFWYIAVGPEQWKKRRAEEIRQFVFGGFGDRAQEWSVGHEKHQNLVAPPLR